MRAALTLAVALTASQPTAATFTYEILLTQDDISVPGLPDATVTSLSNPVIDNTGAVAYRAFISGPGINNSNDDLILRTAPGGSTSLLFREGQSAGLGGDITVLGTSPRALSEAGNVSIFQNVTGTGVTASNDLISGIADSSGLSVLLRERSAPTPPGLGGDTIQNVAVPVLAADGSGLVRSTLTGAGNRNLAIFPFTADGTVGAPILREGDSVDGDPARLVSSLRDDPSINARGDVIVPVGLTDGTEAILIQDGDGFRTLVDSTAPIIGEADLSISFLFDAQIGANGDVVFRAFLSGAGVTGDNQIVILAVEDDGFRIVARRGDPVPGRPGQVYDSFGTPAIDADGDVTFFAGPRLENGGSVSQDVVISEVDGVPMVVVSSGTQDFTDMLGGTFSASASPPFDVSSAVNDAGAIVFSGRVSGQDALIVARPQSTDMASIPLPAAGWLLLSGLGALAVAGHRRRTATGTAAGA
ncbi:MAG: choice-of-anchor tandem repeat NxxGxxAF-containing protein [Paracoccaceae bacterium]